MTATTESSETAVDKTNDICLAEVQGDTNTASGEQTKCNETSSHGTGVCGRPVTEGQLSAEPASRLKMDVKDDPDRLYLESVGIVYEVDENSDEVTDTRNLPSSAQARTPIRIITRCPKQEVSAARGRQSPSLLLARCRHCGRPMKALPTRTSESDVYDLIRCQKSWFPDVSREVTYVDERYKWRPATELASATSRCFMYNFSAWPIADRGLQVRANRVKGQQRLPTSKPTTPRGRLAIDEVQQQHDGELFDKHVTDDVPTGASSTSALELIRTIRSNPDDKALRRVGLLPVPCNSYSVPCVGRLSVTASGRRTSRECSLVNCFNNRRHTTTISRCPTVPAGLERRNATILTSADSMRLTQSLSCAESRLRSADYDASLNAKANAMTATLSPSPAEAGGSNDKRSNESLIEQQSSMSTVVSKRGQWRSGLKRPGRLTIATSAAVDVDINLAAAELVGTRVPVNSPVTGVISDSDFLDDAGDAKLNGKLQHVGRSADDNGGVRNGAHIDILRRGDSSLLWQDAPTGEVTLELESKPVDELKVSSVPLTARRVDEQSSEDNATATVVSILKIDINSPAGLSRPVTSGSMTQYQSTVNNSSSSKTPLFEWWHGAIDRPQTFTTTPSKRSITVVVPY